VALVAYIRSPSSPERGECYEERREAVSYGEPRASAKVTRNNELFEEIEYKIIQYKPDYSGIEADTRTRTEEDFLRRYEKQKDCREYDLFEEQKRTSDAREEVLTLRVKLYELEKKLKK
jgi:hypothetical protein